MNQQHTRSSSGSGQSVGAIEIVGHLHPAGAAIFQAYPHPPLRFSQLQIMSVAILLAALKRTSIEINSWHRRRLRHRHKRRYKLLFLRRLWIGVNANRAHSLQHHKREDEGELHGSDSTPVIQSAWSFPARLVNL